MLFITHDLRVAAQICDRIAVLAQGRLSVARPLAETSVAQIGQWMSGQFPDAAATTEAEHAAA